MKTGKQSPENCKIEIKINGEILEWVPMNLQYLEMEMGCRK